MNDVLIKACQAGVGWGSRPGKDEGMRAVDAVNTEAKRLAIITAAIRCLARGGVAETSISDICKEAGMRSGHLYYYFESKDALLAAIMLLNHDEIAERIEHMLEGQGDLASKILAVHVDAESQRSALGFTPILRMELECYFSRKAFGHAEEVEQADRLIQAIRNAIRQGIGEGQLPQDVDIDAFADAIALIWQGLTHNRLRPDFDLEENARATRLLLRPWLTLAPPTN
jgi:TetR/AcrR family transcriptional repressor of uid operon